MAGSKIIKKRIASVRNTRKITRTMEMVSTAKSKKLVDRVNAAQPYTRKLHDIMATLVEAGAAHIDSPLMRRKENPERIALLVITANRGLCGGYNGGILRTATARLKEIKAAGQNLSLEVSGKRGLAFMKFEQIPVDQSYSQFEDKPAFDDVNAIADRYVRDFTAGRLHRLDVVYQKFLSSARQAPAVETLLPFGDLATQNDRTSGGSGVDYEFLPSPGEILEEIVPAAFKARFFKCFLDAAVGEQIARMVAMKSATENADEMIRDISMEYNRARQTQITSELAEIIGGAAALE
ncbi:MAG: ATP synthase F1 subunit gamma [Planctomycetaceae bacterium]|nr:ATP synthase F1 subunit gamma [Planctomycetaceae bacterium]